MYLRLVPALTVYMQAVAALGFIVHQTPGPPHIQLER